jgi:hypothetical protein
VNKSWLSDISIGCKLPFNLRRLFQTNLGFEEELEEFEGSFEQDEIVDIYNVGKKFTIYFFCAILLFLNIKN